MFGASAHVYDLIYAAAGKDYEAESAEIHRIIQQRRPGARTLLDVACGTGGHLRHLRASYQVTGVDIDPAMLAEAARALPGVTLVEQDMRTLDMGGSFDAVLCLFSSIGYMTGPADLDAALGSMAAQLGDGGVLVVDGWVRPDAWLEGNRVTVDVAADDTVQVVRMGTSRRQGQVTSLEMHHLVGSDRGVEHIVEHHRLTLFQPEEYEAALARAGLSVETLPGPMPGRDRYVGVKRSAR